MIKTEQRLIQIGSSEGITLSKKDLAILGAKRGDILKVQVELQVKPKPQEKLMRDYDAFVDEYGQTLKNLAGR
jgi:hypothetical protein